MTDKRLQDCEEELAELQASLRELDAAGGDWQYGDPAEFREAANRAAVALEADIARLRGEGRETVEG